MSKELYVKRDGKLVRIYAHSMVSCYLCKCTCVFSEVLVYKRRVICYSCGKSISKKFLGLVD